MFLSDVLALIVSALSFLILYHYLRKPPALPFPPGPKRLPLLGNSLDLPSVQAHETFTRWAKEYGDVVYLNALGKHMVILNSDIVARELLDGRSSIYSDRPYLPMIHDPSLIDRNIAFSFRKYGPQWRRERRFFSQYLGRTASRAYYDTQRDSAHVLLSSLLRDPEQLAAHLRHAAVAIILSIAYGYEIQKTNDPFVALGENATNLIGPAFIPGRFLVNIFPWMKYVPSWFPGAGFKKYAAEAREVGRRLTDDPFNDAKRRITEGTAKPSLIASALSDSSKSELVTTAKNVATVMFGAGADTTFSGLYSCILALVLYPEIQLRAQAELDEAIGPATSPSFRLPTFADRPQLPYIDAIVTECLRWFPTVPLGLPHATTEEDVYRGWRIPKGSTVIANAWMMLRDEKTYPDPLEFRPERYLGDDPAPHPILHGCFGFGRRECPGRFIAESSLWIMIASILAAFTLSPAKNEEGQDIDVSYARNALASLTLKPQSFPCTIKPRSREAEMRILQTQPGENY